MKYFTKYFPVEGDIDATCFVIQKNDKKKKKYAFKLEGVSKDKTCGVSNWCKFDLKDLIKVKLFLCSRDIEVGDKYFLEGDEPYEFTRTSETMDFSLIYAYKIIGEISPEATWVKEEDELEKDDLLLDFVNKKHPDESSLGWSLDDKNLPTQSNRYRQEIRIKGPCGHFH